MYKVTADLDGRTAPVNRPVAIAAVNFLHKRERVPVECQMYGDRAHGSRLWDLFSIRDRTLFVPDRFIKTGTNGRAPQIRKCDGQDRVDASPASRDKGQLPPRVVERGGRTRPLGRGTR